MIKNLNNFPFEDVVKGLLKKGKMVFLKNKRKFIIFFLITMLYFFAVVVYQTSMKKPKYENTKKPLSELYLIEFINGWRDYQQNFDVEDLQFGKNFLTFTLNLRFKAKSIFIVKKLAVVSEKKDLYGTEKEMFEKLRRS